jgi:hypothetical protein
MRFKVAAIASPNTRKFDHNAELRRFVSAVVDSCMRYSKTNPFANQVDLQRIMKEDHFLDKIREETGVTTPVVIRSLGNLLWFVKTFTPDKLEEFSARFVGNTNAKQFLSNLNPGMLSKTSKVLNLAICGHVDPDPDALISTILLYNNYLQIPDPRVRPKAYYKGELKSYDLSFIDYIMETPGYTRSVLHELSTPYVCVKRKMIPRHSMYKVFYLDSKLAELVDLINNGEKFALFPIINDDETYKGCVRPLELLEFMASRYNKEEGKINIGNATCSDFLSWKKREVQSIRISSINGNTLAEDGSIYLNLGDPLSEENIAMIYEFVSVPVLDENHRIVGLITTTQVEEKNTFAIMVDCNTKLSELKDVSAWGFVDHHNYEGDDSPYFSLLGRVGANITNIYKDMLLHLDDIYFPPELQLLAISGIVTDTKNLQLSISEDERSADRRTIESLARRFFKSRKPDHFTVKEGIKDGDVDHLCSFLWKKYNQLQQDALKTMIFQDREQLYKKADQKTFADPINAVVLQWEMAREVYDIHKMFASEKIFSELAEYSIEKSYNRGFIMVSGEEVLGLSNGQKDELYCFVSNKQAVNKLKDKLGPMLINSSTGKRFDAGQVETSNIEEVKDSRGVILGYGVKFTIPACSFKSRKQCLIPALQNIFSDSLV